MAVAHKGSISMSLVLIPVGFIKQPWITISILISWIKKAVRG